jgi:mono/diheme cytochrome c family protein
MRTKWLLFTGLAALIVGSPAVGAEPDPAKVEFFEKKVRPILSGHCYACHSADTKPAGGLRVDDRNGLLTGGNTGPAVVPGQPEKSLLLKRVTQDGKRRMPLEGERLTDEQVATLTTWIKDGAAWPAVRVPATLGKPKPRYEKLKKEHWAFQPVAKPTIPAVNDAAWARDDVDRFVLAALEAKGLKPVGDADKITLIRRVTYDLTGLPPTPAEIDGFLKDTSPTAFEKVVDRLLASPRFGEQWGRHWLDVARYAESTGPSRNIPYPHAWKYRDYVIDAVNADVPFNRFVREQVAGDLLAAPNDAEANRLRIATGFLAIGTKDVNQRFKTRFEMDNVDEQIDVVTRSVLGLTVSCARCHDHKFDPIPTTDYYSLAGIFTSTENAAGLRNQMGGAGLAYYVPAQLIRLNGELPPADPKEVERLTAEVAEAKKAWDAIRGTPEGLKPRPNGQPFQRKFRLDYERKQAELNALTDPAQRGLAAHGVRDAKVIADTEVRIRGEAEKLGPVVPRGYLTTFTVPGAKPIDPKHSGRLELAEWLTSDKNPLTARVIVNRVWSHLFGRGIVSTVDNFGVTGGVPTHPELLDYLATTFIADGWSVKKLVRQLVLTRAYQLGSDSSPEAVASDPANKFLWRHAPRRLTAEEFRDSVLASAGVLDLTRPNGSVVKGFQMREIPDNGPEAKKIHDAANAFRHRSVYLPLLRGLTPKSLEVFDPVEQTLVSGSRDTTTVPAQALFLLNSPFIRKQSLALAERLLNDGSAGNAACIRSAYRLVLGREPTDKEVDWANTFLLDFASAYRDNAGLLADQPLSKGPVPKKGDVPEIVDPDQADQTGVAVTEEVVRPRDARTAAWLAFVQALYAGAEFRYVR